MTNPTPSIFNNLCRFLLLLLLAAATPTATAQMSTAYSNSQDMDMGYTNFNPGMAIVILVVVCAFFFIGFLSLYLRYFATDAGGSVNPLLSAAAARLGLSKRGLDPEVIDSFPIFRYSVVKDLNIGKGGELECAVCLTEFEIDDTLRLLPKCDHVFHPDCIDAWLTSHRTCPVCRADLTPSQPELVEGTESTHLDESAGLGETQNQVQISVVVDEIPKREVLVGEMPRRSRRGGGKFPRSHSTGHSLIQPGENLEKYTLRLPMELRKQMTSQRLKRTSSCLVVLPTEGSSRRGEGSSRGKRVGRSDRFEWSDRVDRSDRFQRSDRWVFSMTPPFISRARLVTSPKVAAEGEATAVGRAKVFLTSVKTPSDSLAVKFDGVEQTSTRPPV